MSTIDWWMQPDAAFLAKYGDVPREVGYLYAGSYDVQFRLKYPRDTFVGFLLFMLYDLRAPTPDEWAQLQEARAGGYLAAVCYDPERAMTAMDNYIFSRPGSRIEMPAALFRQREQFGIGTHDMRCIL